MEIDAEFAAGEPVADAQPMADAQVAEPVEDAAEPQEPEAPKSLDDPFPKKAQNAISRRDKKIGKLMAQLEQERARFAELESKYTPKKSASEAPKEADFDSYADYLEAKNEWRIEQKFTERDSKQQETQRETQKSQQEQAWVAEREQAVAVQAQAFIKENPDALELVEEYGDVIDELPSEIQRIFLEADNAPLAFYNLAKEGKLESLGSMSPARAAMIIGQAQTQTPKKPTTKAPQPMTPAKGTGSGGKSLDSMSTDELLKWVKK